MPAMSDCSWPIVPWILRILTRFAGNRHPNLGETEEALSGCQVRASQRGNPHLTAAFPRLEAWILSRPV